MDKFIFPILDHYGGPILFGVFAILYSLEYFFTLRTTAEKKFRRLFRSGLLSSVGFIVLRLGVIPAMVFTAIWCEGKGIGLFNWISVHTVVEFIVTFLLLDYSMYIWHRLNHRVPFLWRFHNVHHTDLELDITTAIRFHFGEIVFSIFYRSLVVLVVGAQVETILIYEIVFQAATAFHHSNLKLPKRIEANLVRIIVTPRMHGIHHSVYKSETDSNYSTLFAFWDKIHKTKKLEVSQSSITIGVPAWRDLKELNVTNLLKLPFTKQRDWQLPDGTKPLERDIEPLRGVKAEGIHSSTQP